MASLFVAANNVSSGIPGIAGCEYRCLRWERAGPYVWPGLQVPVEAAWDDRGAANYYVVEDSPASRRAVQGRTHYYHEDPLHPGLYYFSR